MKLTEPNILELICRPGEKDNLVRDEGQYGLMVRVGRTARQGLPGGRSYLAQYRLAGRNERIPLGICSTGLSLKAARKAAAAILGQVASGQNPAAQRKKAAQDARAERARDRLTLDVFIGDWTRLHLAQARESHRDEAPRAIRHAFKDHLARPAEALARADAVRALDRLDPAMAAATARYGRALYNWGIKRGTVEVNPFAKLPYRQPPARDRVHSDAEIAAIWHATAHPTVPAIFGNIVRLLFLTAARRDEVADMRWSEFSADLSTWTLPSGRAKNHQPHVIPLPPPARDILVGLLGRPDDVARAIEKRRGERVLPGQHDANWSRNKKLLDAASGVTGWRLHDIRRTAATNLQKLGVRLEVTEAVLNHVSGSRSGIVGIYQRHDWAGEKRTALEAWARRLAEIAEGREAAGNVTPLRAAG